MGFGNFSSRGENDMILRNSNTGGVEVYDVANNQITGAAFMGAVGLNWQFSVVGNFSGRGESDMLLRNSMSVVSLPLKPPRVTKPQSVPT